MDAMESRALEILAEVMDGMLCICIQNHIKKQGNLKESTQIGLRTCRKIMEEHQGAFAWYQKGESFVVELQLPVSPREA